MRFSGLIITLATVSMVAAQGGGNQQNAQGQNYGQGGAGGAGGGAGGANANYGQGNQNGQGAQGGAYAGATTAGANFALFMQSLPKCFSKCATDQNVAATIGCSSTYNGQNNGQNNQQNQGGGGGQNKDAALAYTDVNCVCSNPQYLSSLLSCASYDKDCSQNQYAIQQGQSAFTSFCRNNTQSSTTIGTTSPATNASYPGRNRVASANEAIPAHGSAAGSIILTAVLAGAAALL